MKQHWWCDYCEVCLTNHIKVLIFYDERVFCLGTHCRKQQGTQSDIMPFPIGGLEASTDIYALTGIFKISAGTIIEELVIYFLCISKILNIYWSILFWWRRILDARRLLNMCAAICCSLWLWWIHDIFHRCMWECILLFLVCESMFVLQFTIHEYVSKLTKIKYEMLSSKLKYVFKLFRLVFLYFIVFLTFDLECVSYIITV